MKSNLYILLIAVLACFVSCDDIDVLFEEDISEAKILQLAPSENAVLIDSIVNFSWNTVLGATEYQVQVATPNFTTSSQIVFDSTIVDTLNANSQQLSLLLQDNEYEWRVRGLNGSSETTYSTLPFSVAAQPFNVDISEETVVLVAPSAGTALDVRTPTFAWESVDFADLYNLQIAYPSFDEDEIEQTVVDTIVSTTSSSHLLENRAYEWRVKALNSLSETETVYSETRDFTVTAEVFEDDISNETVTIIAPQEGANVSVTEVTFVWEEVPFAENYKLQVFLPNGTVLQELPNDTSVTMSLTENGTYQWRIRAENTNSTTAYTTTNFEVTVIDDDDLSTQTIQLLTPTNGITLPTNAVIFTWQGITNADSYELQVIKDGNQTVVNEAGLGSTSSMHTLSNGQYEWRVRAKNETTQTYTPYTTYTLTIDASDPNDISNETVTLIAPSNGVSLATEEVNFTWESVTNADEYTIEIAAPSFTNPTQTFQEIVTTTSYMRTLANGSYEWRVKAKNTTSQIETAFSNINSFTVDVQGNFSDQVVSIISPPDGFISNVASLNIQWLPVTDATLYRIQVLDATGTTILNEQMTTQTNIPFTFPEGDVVWQVRAETTSESTQYTSQTITIDTQVPNTPTLLTPTDTEIVTSTSVTFTWSRTAIAGTAEQDVIYISDDAGLTNLVLQEDVSGGSFTTTLADDTTYYWYMNANDAAGNQSSDSTVFSFTIDE